MEALIWACFCEYCKLHAQKKSTLVQTCPCGYWKLHAKITHFYEHVFMNIGNLKPNQGKRSYQQVLVNIGYLMLNQGEALLSCSGQYWILNAKFDCQWKQDWSKHGCKKWECLFLWHNLCRGWTTMKYVFLNSNLRNFIWLASISTIINDATT